MKSSKLVGCITLHGADVRWIAREQGASQPALGFSMWKSPGPDGRRVTRRDPSLATVFSTRSYVHARSTVVRVVHGGTSMQSLGAHSGHRL